MTRMWRCGENANEAWRHVLNKLEIKGRLTIYTLWSALMYIRSRSKQTKNSQDTRFFFVTESLIYYEMGDLVGINQQ